MFKLRERLGLKEISKGFPFVVFWGLLHFSIATLLQVVKAQGVFGEQLVTELVTAWAS